jgi:two-component system, chemotaxis family, protein-glutamate methylesterase/glutaminase
VVTLDVEMPEVSGLDALPAILAVHEAPVVMVSALTQKGADVTLQALELGAVDFMPKPERNQLAEIRACRDLLVDKILTAAQSRVRRLRRTPPSTPAPSSSPSLSPRSGLHPAPRVPKKRSTAASTDRSIPLSGTNTETAQVAPFGSTSAIPCLLIGISTGGPQALSQVFPLLNPPVPPILVVQHMPAQFTRVFAERLNRSSPLVIKEAVADDVVLPNQVLIAPGGHHMTLVGHPPRVRVVLSDEPPVSGHKPSVDVLFQSAAKVFQSAAVGILMTGMGRDGVDGCKAILAAGGLTLGQDEATSVVYGMNKTAFMEGALKTQFALDELAGLLQNIVAFRAELEVDHQDRSIPGRAGE